jgi:serine/threonine protein kinase
LKGLIGKTLGKYQIVEQVGKGGMATVFKAYQPGLDRYVAVKVLPAYYAHEEGFAERFVREAKAIARLDHPNILPVYDFGQDDGLSYIVMKYVAGGTLKDRLGEALTIQQTLPILKQIAAALDHAHDLGILHRDVKPGNILIDEKGWVYLSDFGLAKMVEGSVQLTGTGTGVGTPAYMSPEQGQGHRVDERTDVYSLGVTLYEMLTGRVPYEAETPMAVVVKHITSPLPLPRSINPAIPEPVERVILKALAKNPEDRFPRAGELVNALEVAIASTEGEKAVAVLAASSTTDSVPQTHETVTPPPSYRTSPPEKRNGLPLLAVTGMAGALILVGVVLVVTLLFLLGRGGTSGGGTEAGSSGPVTIVASGNPTLVAGGLDPTDTPTSIPPTVAEEETLQPTATRIQTATGVPIATSTPTPSPPSTSTPLPADTPSPTSTLVPTFTPLPPTSTPTPIPPTSTPAPIPLLGRLVFHRNPGSHDLSDNEIYVYDIQRGLTTRLTDNAFNDWIPRWSPDGGRIAFTSNRDNEDSQNYDVWVMSADGSYPQRYISTAAWDEYSAWSPLDNGEIAIATTADNNSEIHVGAGRDLRRLTFNTIRDEWPTWSPDGKQIAHSNYQFDKGDIYVTDVTNGATDWLYGTEGDDNQPAWSPDSRWIVFVQRSNDKDAFGRLVLISADGSSPSTLTPTYATNPAWSPDSEWIVFARGLDSNENGELDEKDETDLWAVERASGTLVPLVQAPGADFAPSWTY